MPTAAEHLRHSLAKHADARATRRLSAIAGAAAPDATDGAAFLCSSAAEEALSEAVGQGQLTPEAARAVVGRMVAVRSAQALDPARHAMLQFALALPTPAAAMQRIIANGDATSRGQQARDWAQAVGPAARRLAQAHEEAAHVASGARAALAAASGLELGGDDGGAAAEAKALLDATDDAAAELLPWLCRRERRHTWHGLLHAMRGGHVAVPGPPVDRFRRAAAPLRKLGFGADLDRRLRAAVDRRQWGPWCTWVAAPGLPHVHVARGAVEYGLWSEMAASEGVAAGLSVALTPARTPVEGHPSMAAAAPGAAGAMGGLFMQLWADPVYLAAVHGLSGSALDVTARHAAVVLLAIVRATAALSLPVDPEVGHFEARCEARAAALSRALGCSVPVAVAGPWWAGPRVAAVTCQGRLAGLALHGALRNVLDEDWFANPRAAERLRGAGMRAGALDARAWCREQGGSPSGGVARVLELLP